MLTKSRDSVRSPDFCFYIDLIASILILILCVHLRKVHYLNQSNISKSSIGNEQYSYGDYSLDEFCEFTKQLYYGEFYRIKESSNCENHLGMRGGIIKILSIENISFQYFIENYEAISNKYYNGRKNNIAKQYGLLDVLGCFSLYLSDKRTKKLSIKGFHDFLRNEVVTQKTYNENKPAGDDLTSILTTAASGKNPISKKLTTFSCEKIIEIISTVLEREDKTIFWLANRMSLSYKSTFGNWIEKYYGFQNPSLSDALEWFWHYYMKNVKNK